MEIRHIDIAVSVLEQNSRPPRGKKLADSGLWRVRVRKYRIVYAIDDKDKLVTIVRVPDVAKTLIRGYD